MLFVPFHSFPPWIRSLMGFQQVDFHISLRSGAILLIFIYWYFWKRHLHQDWWLWPWYSFLTPWAAPPQTVTRLVLLPSSEASGYGQGSGHLLANVLGSTHLWQKENLDPQYFLQSYHAHHGSTQILPNSANYSHPLVGDLNLDKETPIRVDISGWYIFEYVFFY